MRGEAFRRSANATYSFAFLAIWAIALVTRSRAALAIALFGETNAEYPHTLDLRLTLR